MNKSFVDKRKKIVGEKILPLEEARLYSIKLIRKLHKENKVC